MKSDRTPRQVGALPFKILEGRLRVLLITNKAPSKWLVPKGHVEPLLSEGASALAEAHEEAGVLGEISRISIGTWIRSAPKTPLIIPIYPLIVLRELDRWPDQLRRQRQWLPVEAAAGTVESRQLSLMIRALPSFLNDRSREAFGEKGNGRFSVAEI